MLWVALKVMDCLHSVETLDSIERCATKLAANRDQYRTLSRRTRSFLRRDKERYVRSLAEDVECH